MTDELENKKRWISTIKSNELNCRPVLEAQRCYTRILSTPECSISEMDDPMVETIERGIAAANFTVNFVCREYVEGEYRELM